MRIDQIILGRAFLFLLLASITSGCASKPLGAQAVAEDKSVGSLTADGFDSFQWLRYFEKPGTKSNFNGRPLMLYFTADSCDPCKMMRKWTFSDRRVVEAMDGFIPMRIRGNVELQITQQFGIKTFPTIVFFSREKGEIDRKAGFRKAGFLLRWMEEVKENRTTISALTERLELDPADLDALLGQTRNYVDADRTDEALGLVNRAEKIAPENARVLAITGLCLLTTGRIEEAEIAIDAALAKDENSKEARELKNAILMDKAETELARGDAEEAMELFSSILRIEPENHKALIGTGHALMKLDLGESARKRFALAAEHQPGSPLPHEALGNYYRGLGDDGAAEEEFLMAIEVEPRYEPAYFRLIDLYEKHGQRADMMRIYEMVLPIAPAGAHNEIAWLMATSEHSEIRNPKAAIRHAGIAVELEPRPWYIDTLAEAYYAAGRYGAAIAIIKEAIAKEPDNLQYYEDQLAKFQDARNRDTMNRE